MKAKLRSNQTITYVLNSCKLHFVDGFIETDKKFEKQELAVKNSPWEVIEDENEEVLEKAKEDTSVSRKSLYDLAKTRGWDKHWRDSKRDDLIEFLKKDNGSNN